jgi:hypothetical protein
MVPMSAYDLFIAMASSSNLMGASGSAYSPVDIQTMYNTASCLLFIEAAQDSDKKEEEEEENSETNNGHHLMCHGHTLLGFTISEITRNMPLYC